jgi:Condensation domain
MSISVRAVTPVESLFSLSPFSVVAMVFRLKGQVDALRLEQAVSAMQIVHPLLQAKIIIGEDGNKYFDFSDPQPIPVKFVNHGPDSDWMDIYHRECRTPFEFEQKPSLRIVLIKSDSTSELMLFAHHLICDGLSLAHLGHDILCSMHDSASVSSQQIPALPLSRETLPHDIKANWLIKKILARMNKKYAAARINFNFDDYKKLHRLYWSDFNHKMIPIVLTKTQTASFIRSCKTHNVSVNSALTTAVIGAQQVTFINKVLPKKSNIAVSIRDMLQPNPGKGLGFFAGSLDVNLTYDTRRDFWTNTLRFHKKIKSGYKPAKVFSNLLHWCHMEPGLMESINFKLLGYLAGDDPDSKLYSFSQRKDFITALLQHKKMTSPDSLILGTAVTNLMDLGFSEKFGELELESVIMNPGAAFPLSMVQMVAAAATVSGRMSILLEYEERRFTKAQAELVKNNLLKLIELS